MADKTSNGGATPRGRRGGGGKGSTSKSKPAVARAAAARSTAKPAASKGSGARSKTTKSRAAKPAATKSTSARATGTENRAAASTSRKSLPRQTSSSVASIVSAILAELKPTLDQIRELAASFGQELTKGQGKGKKDSGKKGKKR